MKGLARLGFTEDEELEYQESFGEWRDVRQYLISEEETREKYRQYDDSLQELIKKELKLKRVEELVEEYFTANEDDNEGLLCSILFLIADFGKGKTSFLRYFAARLAKQYLKTHEGLLPVYINLNEFDKYSNSPSLGIFANFLETKFKIDITDEYFKKKDYFFLVDSLDECGELTETNIEKVIKNVIEIQNLDRINQRNNRVIIASRPIAVGLVDQIKKYKPFVISKTDKETKRADKTQNYISVYGFKKEQFDNYIEYPLTNDIRNKRLDTINFKGFSKKVIESLIKGEKTNLFKSLYQKVLKGSELKRPIFAYMIYKLIASNSNFIDFGKVGVYISFLNQLSRDAKHKDDDNYPVKLLDEYVYRNILTASALLWQYKRQSGEQTNLTKADICRTIEENEIDRNDKAVLEKFPDIESINFLSHSYLGEKENTLHFQHQSFAEILLAEYYLKVFIKYAIEENESVEDARIRLSVGVPTDQTIEFFKGLLMLLKECALGNPDEKSVIMKRKLFIPLLASMSLTKHNKKLYSSRLDLKWFDNYKEDIFIKNSVNEQAVKDFPVTKDTLNKIENLCQKILSASKTYYLDEATPHTVLFKNELISANNIRENLNEIDKWLSLLVGNIIGTNVEKKVFFNFKIEAKISITAKFG